MNSYKISSSENQILRLLHDFCKSAKSFCTLFDSIILKAHHLPYHSQGILVKFHRHLESSQNKQVHILLH